MTRPLIFAFFMMLFSTTVIVIGDTAARLLSFQGYSPLFVAWTRFILAGIVLLPFSGLKRAELRGLLDWRVILRSALICGAICSILMALKTEPLANAFGAFFISPIVSYTLSAIILKEKISIQRSILLAIGFCGVLLVVRPGFGMTTGIGFAVLAGGFHGTYLMTTRLLVGEYRPRFMLISQLLIGAVLLLPFSTIDVPPVTSGAVVLVVISAMGSAIGNLVMVITNKTTPASVVAPLIYLQLVSGVVVGYLVFAEWPDQLTLWGLSIILAAGFSSLWFAGRGR